MKHVDFLPSGCYLWGDTTTSNSGVLLPTMAEKKQLKIVPSHIRKQYLDYKQQLEEYNNYVYSIFQLKLPLVVDDDVISGANTNERYTDIRHALRHYSRDVVCDALHVPWGTASAAAMTNDDGSKSLLSYIQQHAATTDISSTTGIGRNKFNGQQFMEPLLPPLRHLDMCQSKRGNVMNMQYMVHDFSYICRTMTQYTRTIFVDMGASLLFHAGKNPAVTTAKLYEQFGIVFDHVYAFEMTPFSPDNTTKLFTELIPDVWRTSYHWMNVGVESTVGAPLNPFTMIKKYFKPDDFIVVKLDIDTPYVELPLAQELLHDTQLHTLVDQFYFEYHVKLKELNEWGDAVEGSIYDALHLMTQLRENGIAAHFWV